jgi:hypothetical protein
MSELQHFGIPGMKWGHRKNPGAFGSAIKSRIKEVGRYTKNSTLHPIITSRAANASIRGEKLGTQVRRMYVGQKTKEIKDVNDRVDVLMAKKAAEKALKKAEKAKIKDIKTQYRKEYMDGESKVGKIYSKLTDADKIYADVMYDLNKK